MTAELVLEIAGYILPKFNQLRKTKSICFMISSGFYRNISLRLNATYGLSESEQKSYSTEKIEECDTLREVRLNFWAEFGCSFFHTRTGRLKLKEIFVYGKKQLILVWTNSAQMMQHYLP